MARMGVSVIEMPLNILLKNPGGQRRRGRPTTRWLDGVEADCVEWKSFTPERDSWRETVEEAKVHNELFLPQRRRTTKTFSTKYYKC